MAMTLGRNEPYEDDDLPDLEQARQARNQQLSEYIVDNSVKQLTITDSDFIMMGQDDYEDEDETPFNNKSMFRNMEKPKVANVWVMTPNNANIQQVKYNFELRSKFPNGFECFQFLIDDIMDYYVVFFDADDSGAYNQSAKWVAGYCGVAPTGNFIIMRKKLIDDEEHIVEINITPKELKQKYWINKIHGIFN